jgi:hypothetical protein
MVDFVRAPSKSSLLALLKKAKSLNPRLLRSLFDGVVFKSEMKSYTLDIDYAFVTANDAATDVTASEFEELTDGSQTTLHTHDDCPEYKLVSAATQAEGDLHLSDVTTWATSKMLIKKIKIETASTDWDLWVLQNDNGYSTDDAAMPAIQFMSAGNGDEIIKTDHPYEDEDATDELHLYVVDNSGSATFDIYTVGYGLQ